MIIKVLYNESYKVADHVGVWAQPINGDHLKLYQIREESRIVIETYIRDGELFNSEK